ncbi:DUF5801 repeats-in-toxin domain-containing protein, partial [Chthoniobacter flavus]
LSVSSSGVDSGLIDSLSGNHVFLFLESGAVVAREGTTSVTAATGPIEFTLSVDGSGNVTATLDRSVHQGSADSPVDNNEAVSLTSGLVTLTATITDADGDHQAASIDLGSHVSIHDDGPTITAVGTATALNVDESFLPTGSGTGPAGSTVDTEAFAGAFTHVNGADGASVSYGLSVSSSGVDSGLIDSLTGNHVFLFLESGAVVAREGTTSSTAATGPVEFTLSVDGSGNVTATLDRSVHQGSADSPVDSNEAVSLTSGLVTLTATVTDADGDHQAASIDLGSHVSIHDDGPSITAVGTATALNVDESFLPTGSGTGPAGSTVDTEAFAGAFTHVNGADGASVSYGLSVSASGVDSGLIDSLTGNHVFLFLESGAVVAREGTTSVTAATGPIEFTLSVDGTGNVTATLDRSVHQSSADSPVDSNEAVSLTSGLVTLTATITDADGDHQAASIDLGSHVSIHDDGPSITAVGTATALNVDESFLPTGSGTGPAGSTVDTEAFAGAFTHVNGADGASISYGLSVSASGVDSGLIDSLTGNHVFLFLESGSVVAREGTTSASAATGPVEFTLSVDGSGNVTATLDRSVHQSSADSPVDSSEAVSLTSGLVTLTATITDADGDHQAASIDLGSHVSIHDDGPSITAVGTATALNVDESFLPTGSGTGPAGSTTDTEAFAGAFTHVNGADGASISYGLSVSASGVDSGLIDSLTGNHVFLFLESGTVVAREGTTSATAATGPIEFTLSVDGSGNVTATLDRSVHQSSADAPVDSNEAVSLTSGLVTLTATITDADGDHQAASIDLGSHVSIHDDGPSITAVGTATALNVDESFLPTGSGTGPAGSTVDTEAFAGAFTHVNGADGASVSYGLSVSASGVDSGLIDSLTGNHVFLFLESGAVVAREGTTSVTAATGPVEFTFSVDGSGNVTATLDRSVHQSSADSPVDSNEAVSLTSGLVTLTATITDGDGDHQAASIDLGSHVSIHDDGPSITAVGTATALNVDESFLPTGSGTGPAGSTTDTEAFAGAFTHVNGADGASVSYGLSVSASGVDSGLIDSLTGNHVFLFLESGAVVAREGTTSVTAATGPIEFTLSVDGSGNVTATLDRSVHQGSADAPVDSNEAVSLTSGLVTLTATITDGDGDHQAASIDLGSHVSIHDDGPSITAVGTATALNVDESFLPTGSGTGPAGSTVDTEAFAGAFTHVNGADGASVSYGLSVSSSGVDSGLIDSLTGNHVFLFLESGAVVAREGTTSATAATGPIEFTLSVDGSGNVTATLDRSVHQGSADSPVDSNEAV